MRILALGFKNLNSLYGEFRIDFEDPAYLGGGIFAITGKTGAGKSTILDALTLGLYGRTARLGAITGASNELLSRGAAECSAWVRFRAGGKVYRASWEQRRTRRRDAKKALAPYNRELSEVESGKILADRPAECDRLIREIAGLGFEEFTKTVLLAQGQFTAFLTMEGDGRAALLEELTGTEIYSEISREVYFRRKKEAEATKRLEIELEGVLFLPPEEREALEKELAAREAERLTLEAEQTLVEAALRRLRNIRRYREELTAVAAAEEAQLRARAEFAPDRLRLVASRRAESCNREFTALAGLRKQRADARISLEKAREDAEKAEASLRREWGEGVAERRLLQSAVEEALQREETLRAVLAEGAAYLETNAAHRELERICDGLARQQADLKREEERADSLRKTLKKRESEALRLAADRENAARSHAELLQLRQIEGAKAKAREAASETLLAGKPKNVYDEEREALYKTLALVRQIASFEEERAKLADGEACPLCGAKEHPFALGNLPETGPVERRLSEINALFTALAKLEKEFAETERRDRELARQQGESETALALLDQRLETGRELRAALEEELRLLGETLRAERRKLTEELLALGETGELPAALERLAARRDRYAEALRQQQLREKELAALETGRNQLAASLREAEAALDRLKESLGGEEPEPAPLPPGTPDEALLRRNRERRDRLNLEAGRLRGVAAALERQLAGLEPALAEAETLFLEKIAEAEFADEAAFRAALLPEKEHRRLEAAAEALEHEGSTLAGRRRSAETLLAEELAAGSDPRELPELEARREELAALHGETMQSLGGVKEKLAADALARQRGDAKARALEAQRLELKRWALLDKLIGGSDAKLYRNFVQRLTFAQLVGRANRNLARMTPRYLLEPAKEGVLGLNVIDLDQAGEVRTIRNLSGGESFLVSLSLALGLSEMAGRKTPVESLFLDEGFGTLDEESLETALSALGSLRRDDALIGVISHIAALKERIPLQIEVQPRGGGRSTLTGPGVTAE